ncbi:hypothetical protein HDU87_006301 [Geranomyces variabilis]|uniref:SH3 domain-containing protein n=1 Tax=Geranomyces variabilis TaxID=109894 RepID=A0AAD5TG33_9FUNG|nr:hypothetical protein HDU87_006301 [Geranomyces variabilis]
MQLVKRVVVAATAASTVLADSLPTAPYARIDAASVVAGTKWLLIGGTSALQTTDKNYTAATTALGGTVTQLDLASETATAVKTTVNGKSVNRSQVSGQICEYDSNSGNVYCFGGIDSTGRLAPGIGVFNPATDTWEQDQQTDISLRTGPASVLLGETVYIFGGNDTTDQLPADLQSFSTSDLTSSRVFTNGAYPSGRVGHCIAGLNDTAFLLVGGETAPGKPVNDAWVFDTVGTQWTDVSNAMSDVWPIHRTGVACTKVGAQVALFGGVGSAKPFDDLWLINNSTLKPISRPGRRREFNIWARQTDAGGSAGAPTGRVGAQIANLNNYVGITGGQGANGDSALHFFDAQGNGGWAPSTAALARPLNAAAAKPTTSAPAASQTSAAAAPSLTAVRPAASSSARRTIPTPGQNAGGVPVSVPTGASSSAAAPAASSNRVIPGAGQNAGSAPTTTPAAAQATTQAATQAAPEPTPAPVVFPLPGQNVGGVPTTTTTSATPSSTKTRSPIVGGGGSDDVDNVLLAVLLALPIALAAGLCLLCACFAARRDHKKHANWRQYYRHPETAVREQPVHDHHHAAAPMAAATTAGAAGAAAAAAAAPVALVNNTTTTVSRTATPIRHTQAPGTPHRSDSRRRVHSPLGPAAGAAAGSGAAAAAGGGALHATAEEPARTPLKRYRVLWASTPSQLDEVEAAAGDIVEEKRVFADGWAMVHNVTKGATGMIPINILEELPANRT